MDKKERKEKLRRYKKSRQHAQSSSSSSSSESDSSSYSSSSEDERRKREKREHCQKKLEAKRNHLKRKLKEAKLKKRAAAAAAALSGHSHRALSPATQAKLKKLAERKHQRAASKERREREREKHRAAARERERDHHRVSSRSPTKITKIRIHQDVKQRQKSPPRMHHQLMSREKIIIQTRTRDRTPSTERERQRHEHNKRHHDELARERERRDRDRERAEREAARDKERAEALARCQERQRERERIAREKLRREEEEKKYGSGSMVDRGDRLLPRPAERELAIAASRGYGSRERSLEALERTRHVSNKREIDVYEREREYMEAERRGLLDREEIRREREYLAARRRELSPVPPDHYAASRIRDPRDLYPDNERERTYSRTYMEEGRHTRDRDPWIEPRDMRERGELHEMRDPRDFREIDRELMYADERDRERLLRERERALTARDDWKNDWEPPRERDWHDGAPPPTRSGFVGGPKRVNAGGTPNETITKLPPREQRANSEPDWDADELKDNVVPSVNKPETSGLRDVPGYSGGAGRDINLHGDRRWPGDWHEEEEVVAQRPGNNGSSPMLLHRNERGGGRSGFRRGPDGERNPTGGSNYRPHPPPLMTLPVQPPGGFHGAQPRFPNKRNMTYTNPNLLKKQQAAMAAAKAAAQASAVVAATTAVAAAKAAAQSAANATTNPGILGQVSSGNGRTPTDFNSTSDRLEGDEILGECAGMNVESNDKIESSTLAAIDDKIGSELSEISDSDDEILTKTDKKSLAESDECTQENTPLDDVGTTEMELTVVPGSNECTNTDNGNTEDRAEDDEMLDFEEISDGELEEDARVKAGVGDALGVDWASLIEETKRQAETAVPIACEQTTSAKQKWQPHRLILDLGISMRMAGEKCAKRLLNDAKKKLDEELYLASNVHTKIKNELDSPTDEASRNAETDELEDKKVHLPKMVSLAQKPADDLADSSFNVERLHPLACIQVTERQNQLQRHTMILNACGANSRALSARQDLKLRRQLCGLPAKEYDIPHVIPPTSQKLKAMAMAAFQRTLEVK